LNFDPFTKLKIVGDGLDHTSTRELLARWKADIREGAISDDLAPLLTFKDPRSKKRGYPVDRTDWVELHGSRSPYLESDSESD
jgi:hypothetical protein